jgi:hypothetical protein
MGTCTSNSTISNNPERPCCHISYTEVLELPVQWMVANGVKNRGQPFYRGSYNTYLHGFSKYQYDFVIALGSYAVTEYRPIPTAARTLVVRAEHL